MQVILKSKSKESNRSPHGVILNAHKKARNHSAWGMIHFLTATFAAYAVCLVCLSCAAFAEADLTFTVNVPPVLEITLLNADGSAMGDTVAMDVLPSLNSAGFSEKDVTVNVGTNNEWGYNLIMNVSDTALTSEENNTIANLVEKSGGYTCTPETAATCDFTVNSWGFKIKNTTATQTATNYIPVPTSLNLNKNAEATGDIGEETYVSFASRVNAEQAPGAYSTTIIFTAVANPDPRPVMQETSKADLAALLPNTGDVITMKDSRDSSGYTVTNIDGIYWMTQNLRYMPTSGTTLSPSTTNVTSEKTLAIVDSLASGNSYTEPRVQYDDNTTYGAYYNYCAASAGTVCNDTTTQSAETDICPAGWRLPTQAEIYTINSASGTNFNAVMAGYYHDGTLSSDGARGSWWSATAVSTLAQYYLNYTGNWGISNYYKDAGFSVRCVKSDDPLPQMNEVTSNDLATLLPNVGDTATVQDSRDGTKYTIGKLADGKYWMLDNLALDLTDDDILNALSADNTDIDTTNDSGALAALKGTAVRDPNNDVSGKYATAKVANWTASYSYSAPLVNMSYKNAVAPTGTSNDPLQAQATAGGWKYGGYYNYCAASAGSYCYGSGTSAGTSSGNATSSICPKGWHMPSSNRGEYDTLYSAYSTASPSRYTAFRTAFHLPLSSYYYNGSAGSQGSSGYFWSITRLDDYYMYYLRVNTSSIYSSDYGSRSLGLSVRCVKSDDPSMQNATTVSLSTAMPNSGDSTTLSDARDGENYTITNINGTYWMTDNLRITGTVTAALSNFTGDDFNISAGDLAAGNSYDQARSHYDNNETYGAYYNYCAASAGTVCSSSVQANATVDICPSGWRLPTQAEMQTIVNADGANFNLVLAGYYGIGTLHHAGSRGYWWSAAAYSTSTQYFLYYNGSWGFDDYGRDYGSSVRCVFGA